MDIESFSMHIRSLVSQLITDRNDNTIDSVVEFSDVYELEQHDMYNTFKDFLAGDVEISLSQLSIPTNYDLPEQAWMLVGWPNSFIFILRNGVIMSLEEDVWHFFKEVDIIKKVKEWVIFIANVQHSTIDLSSLEEITPDGMQLIFSYFINSDQISYKGSLLPSGKIELPKNYHFPERAWHIRGQPFSYIIVLQKGAINSLEQELSGFYSS
jgi:hypothetical protein